MPVEPAPLDFDDPRWLERLLRHATSGSILLSLPARRSDLDRRIHDTLWSTGALLGAAQPPAEVLTTTAAEAAFVQLVAVELQEAASILRPSLGTTPDRFRWTLGACLAAMTGELGVASTFDEALRTGGVSTLEEERLFDVLGAQLRRQAYLLGNPQDGLPLHAGYAVLHARTFLRLTAGYLTRPGLLDQRSERYLDRLSQLKTAFLELLANVFTDADVRHPKASPAWRRGAQRQLKASDLTAEDRKQAALGLSEPRAVADLLEALPKTTRPLLVEQVVLAAIMGHRWHEDVRHQFAESARVAGLTNEVIESAEARAAAFVLEHPGATLTPPVRPSMMETALQTTMTSLQEASAAITQQVKGTGELGVLLARLARGESITDEERHKIREQLIDLAKVIPSLAIFAAPGGMLLLPLLIKLLPFDLRPSSFQPKPPSTPPRNLSGLPQR